MYKLRKGVKNNFCSKAPERERKSAYLPASIWNLLEKIAEERDISRNKALEIVLKEYFQVENPEKISAEADL